MKWKKIGAKLLFPPLPVLLLLLPVAAGGLIWTFIGENDGNPMEIGAYALAFYTLMVWCARIPELFRRGRHFKEQNPYARRWLSDTRLRMNVVLLGSFVWNAAYAALQLGMGVAHRSAWFYALAGYYLCLAGTRFFLMRHSMRHVPGGEMAKELRVYRSCGWVMLVLNLALSAMIFYMVAKNRRVRHHEITTIAMATYTFTSLTMAIVNVIRYRRYNSPVFSAAKVISLTSAVVSLLTLENTMLTTFGDTMQPRTHRLFLALSGGGISLWMVTTAVYMIGKASENLKSLEKEYGKP